MTKFKELLASTASWAGSLSRPKLIGTSIALAATLFVSVNIFASRTMDGVRADMTDAQVWTLSQGTETLLSSLEEPLHLRLFLSEGLTEAAPQLASFADRVTGTLRTYADMAGGRITLEIIDPQPFSNEEDRAVGFGIDRFSLAGAGEPLFFGLAATNSTDGRSTIPVFSPEREAWLEYDLTRLVAELGQPTKPKIALIDGLGLSGNPQFGQPVQQSLSMLRELYDVEIVSGDVSAFPEGTQVVSVVHPQGLSDTTLYALDQWVMGGGALMAFVDPHADTQVGPRGGPAPDASSDLAVLFDAWGIEYDPTVSVVDAEHALITTRRIDGRQTDVSNPAWLRLGNNEFDTSTPMLARLNSLVMTTVGHFEANEGDVSFEPLIFASRNALVAGTAEAADPFGDPRRLNAEGEKLGEAPVLVGRLSGPLRSAFPDGKPEDSNWEAEHLSNTENANVLLSADADMLMNRNWIQQRQFLGTPLPQAFANNGDFFLNAIEQMAGGAALADLRGRAVDWRPLERIEEMQRDAEVRYRATEQALLDRIADAEKALRDIAADGGEQTALFSSDLVAQADELRADLLAARAELRQVQYDLRSDVEAMKSWVTMVNVGVVPIAAALFALVYAVRRPARPLPKRSVG